MFVEEYEKMSRGDRSLFSETVNDLLYQCYIVRKSYDRKSRMFRADPGYMFIERYYSVFEEYLSYMDMTLSKNDEDGIIFVTSGAERNHFRMDPTTTLVVFALRSYYEGQIEKAPAATEVLMTSGQMMTLVQELGLSNVSKRLSSQTIGSILRTLDGFNVVSRATNSYGDPTYTFFIMPTIRYVISSEKLNALYTFLTRPEEEEDDHSPSLFDMPAKEKITPKMGMDIPVEDEGGNN
jgi:hypothetical protein